KDLSAWSDLPLGEDYSEWLKVSGWPFEPDDPKYSLISFPGLVAPRLREFREDVQPNLTGMLPGMGGRPPGPAVRRESPQETKSAYPDIEGKLPKIRQTLDK